MRVSLPAGPALIFSLTPAIFRKLLRLAVFVWNCWGAILKEGRFLSILRKTSRENMPKNRAGKNRAAVFLFL
jgi:hypothetical protein